jgi:hypothetical protein
MSHLAQPPALSPGNWQAVAFVRKTILPASEKRQTRVPGGSMELTIFLLPLPAESSIEFGMVKL